MTKLTLTTNRTEQYSVFENGLLRQVPADAENPLVSVVHMGDMCAVYYGGEDCLSLTLVPASRLGDIRPSKLKLHESLLQVSVEGDVLPEAYSGGISMRNSQSTALLKLDSQYILSDQDQVAVVTEFHREDGQRAIHTLKTHTAKTLLSSVTYINDSPRDITLRMLSSFSITGLTPFIDGEAPESMVLHRFRSYWSAEGRPESLAVEDIQLDPSWSKWATKCERYGQVGCMPTRHFFPFAAIEDTLSGVTWGAEIVWPGSWQMEPYRRGDALSLSGGLADFEFGHWSKILAPGASFTTPEAILTVTQGNREDVCDRLLTYFDPYLASLPASEQELPVIYNEYCDTWCHPTTETVRAELEALRGMGVDYFVIDDGWFRKPGVEGVGVDVGDWEVSKERFDGDMRPTLSAIRKEGLLPGLWFEYENVGRASDAYTQYSDHFLRLNGHMLQTPTRAFWDFTDPWVQDYLHLKVALFLKENQVGYIKVDYNDFFGIGCDGAESPGEGLRRQVEAMIAFKKRLLETNPDLVLENCASGGHRLDPCSMSTSSMASFSDAHECKDIPVIAANLHSLIPPRQSQIWAVIRKEDDHRRIVYSMVNGLLGRLCVSGNIASLNEEQRRLVQEGVAFYKTVRHIIKDGISRRRCCFNRATSHLQGWQAVVRRTPDGGEALVVFNAFAGIQEPQVRLDGLEGYEVRGCYTDGKPAYMEGGELVLTVAGDFSAIGVHLAKRL